VLLCRSGLRLATTLERLPTPARQVVNLGGENVETYLSTSSIAVPDSDLSPILLVSNLTAGQVGHENELLGARENGWQVHVMDECRRV